MEYSIIIPVYNEEKILENTINKIINILENTNNSFEILVSNDGSVDRTDFVITNLSEKHSNIKCVSSKVNQGRGSALHKAFLVAEGKIQLYIDADLAIEPLLLLKVIKEIEAGADIAIGSKHLKNSEVEYPRVRRFLSKGYSFLVRLLLGTSTKDYQCGLKGFKKEVINILLPKVKDEGWSWDTELIVRAEWAGYTIVEIPAKVVNIFERESKVHLLRDTSRMGLGVVRLFFEKLRQKA